MKGFLSPISSARRPKTTFAGIWTVEYNAIISRTSPMPAPKSAEYNAITGTVAFLFMVSMKVAASKPKDCSPFLRLVTQSNESLKQVFSESNEATAQKYHLHLFMGSQQGILHPPA